MRLALRFDMRAPDIGVAAVRPVPGLGRHVRVGRPARVRDRVPRRAPRRRGRLLPGADVQASAILARTKRMRVHFSALIAVLHDPLRLAEDLAVLDLISGGRIEMTLGHRLPPARVRDVRRPEVAAGADPRGDHPHPRAGVDRRAVRVPRPHRAWSARRRCRSRARRSTSAARREASAYRAARLGDNYLPADARAVRDLPGGAAAPRQAGARRRRRSAGRCSCSSPTTRNGTGRSSPRTSSTRRTRTPSGPRSAASGSTPYPPVVDVEDLKASDKFAVVTPDECVELATSLPPTPSCRSSR